METIKYSGSSLTEIEAAEYLGIAAITLRKSRMTGMRGGNFESPPFIRLGRSVRYLKQDLDKYLSERRITPKKPGGTQ